MEQHPLNQAFVIEAMGRYAGQIVEHKQEVMESMKNSFIEPAAWIGCAEKWQKTEE